MSSEMRMIGYIYKHYDTLSKKRADKVATELRAKGKIVSVKGIGGSQCAIWVRDRKAPPITM